MVGDTDQVMPAQDLMQDDAIGKASEPRAKDEASPNQWLLPHHLSLQTEGELRRAP